MDQRLHWGAVVVFSVGVGLLRAAMVLNRSTPPCCDETCEEDHR